MTKLPSDLRRYNIVESNFSKVLISKRNSKGVYKIVYDKDIFENELSALQSMSNSSHFTRVLRYDRAEKFMYLERGEVVFDMFRVMVSTYGVVPYDTASQFTSDLLGALKHLHTTDLCHGDIKLENMVSSNGTFKLIDMGLSCPAKEFKSQVGSVSYLPPEGFIANVSVNGHKSDIWSSGICIFASWCSMNVPWNAANVDMDKKLSNGKRSIWENILSNFNIIEYCYRLSHYLGPSMIASGMLKINPLERSPAEELLQLWNLLKR